MPALSVIIPFYNSAACAERCLASVQAQTQTDWELIAVDDGSPDDTGAILDRLAAGEPRMRVIHQPNGGPSAARNRGLEEAHGDYITFVDADDLIEPSYLSDLLTAAQDEQADAALIGRTVITAGGTRERLPLAAAVMAPPSAVQLAALPKMPWGRLYRADIIRRSGARFPLCCRYGEDTAFHYLCYPLCAKVVAIGDSCGYLYIVTEGSLTSHAAELVGGLADATAFVAEHYRRHPQQPALERQLLVLFALHAVRRILSSAPKAEHRACAATIRRALTANGITEADLGVLKPKHARILRSVLRGGCGYTLGYRLQRLLRRLRGKA